MINRWMLAVVALLAAVTLTSCSSLYHHAWRTDAPDVSASQNVTLHYLEVDDEGWFWDRRQADALFTRIDQSLEAKNTIIVTFVHGWHHCAECCDDNVEGFRRTLNELDKTLAGNFNIVGVFVGWRGKSLPMPLNLATFWGRKCAAERIGESDLRELFMRLQKLFAAHRPDVIGERANEPVATPQKFLGLVTIGHSFGAQIVLRSVATSIESQLMRLNPHPAYLRGATPAQPEGEPVTVSGFGDLVVLINPAIEASQYHRLHVLSHGLNYLPLQTPLVLTVSAEDDYARHRLFKWGRMLGEFFTGKPRKDDPVQRTVEREALGVFGPHVTHLLEPTDGSVSLEKKISTTTPECRKSEPCKVEWLEWKTPPATSTPDSLQANDGAIATFDFSGDVVFGNVRLRRTEANANGSAFQPLIVARASNKVIANHSGIFSRPFIDFLVPYVTFIERKSRENLDTNRTRREEQMRRVPVEPAASK